MGDDIRSRLVSVALEWQKRFGVAPAVTSAISEFDAFSLVGMSEEEYCTDCIERTAVTSGHDFKHNGCRYQIKANRPSGKPGSPVRLVGKAKNLAWDKLIWILYDRDYCIQEAWEWTVEEYRTQFEFAKRLAPTDMRKGRRIYPAPGLQES
jgi:hypothetical protein